MLRNGNNKESVSKLDLSEKNGDKAKLYNTIIAYQKDLKRNIKALPLSGIPEYPKSIISEGETLEEECGRELEIMWEECEESGTKMSLFDRVIIFQSLKLMDNPNNIYIHNIHYYIFGLAFFAIVVLSIFFS